MHTLPNIENIIVAVVHNNKFNWYILPTEICFMDYDKWAEAFRKRGFEIKNEYIDDRRKNLFILDTNTATEFLGRIDQDKVTTDDLQEGLLLFKNEIEDDWFFDYRPSLYIDFDKKILYSHYGEPISMEKFVPSGWLSDWKDFKHLVPSNEKYWINDGENYLIYPKDKETDLS